MSLDKYRGSWGINLKKEVIHSLGIASRRSFLGIRLQNRDYKILRFILEQKFASLEMIYLLCFDRRKNESEAWPKNLWTVRQKLSKLRSQGLLKTEKVLSSGKAHFLITPLGLRSLAAYFGKHFPIRPAKRIDFSLYEHDYRLSLVRISLERKGICRHYFSEKRIRSAPVPLIKNGFRFFKDLIPDGIFINKKNERVAIELEASRKGIRKVISKIRHYEDYLRGSYYCPYPVLDKVWIVVTKKSIERVYRHAIKEVAINSLCYRIDYYENVVPKGIK